METGTTAEIRKEARALLRATVARVDLHKELELIYELMRAGGAGLGLHALGASARSVRQQIERGVRFVEVPAAHARLLRVKVVKVRRSRL